LHEGRRQHIRLRERRRQHVRLREGRRHRARPREVERHDRAGNIKLGRGGIREIEFIAQVFQLIRGGHDAALRRQPTLDVLALLAECAARDVGVMVIKAAAKQPWGEQKPTHGTWYEPQTTPEGIRHGIRFALSHPGVHAFCSPGDLSLLPLVLDAAEGFVPYTDTERTEAVATALADNDPLIFPLAESARH
jgi:hypothetical protein